jgi:transposase
VGANPVDRGKPGSKLHLVCDGGGLPLTAAVTAANVNDTSLFQAVVEDIPPIRTPAGRRRTRPAAVHADKAYDSAANRAWLRRRGIKPRIARRGVDSSTRLGRHRWKVERSLSWLSCFRRLQVRWDRDSGRWFAFVLVACALVCCNRLAPEQHRPPRLDSPATASGTSRAGGVRHLR